MHGKLRRVAFRDRDQLQRRRRRIILLARNRDEPERGWFRLQHGGWVEESRADRGWHSSESRSGDRNRDTERQDRHDPSAEPATESRDGGASSPTRAEHSRTERKGEEVARGPLQEGFQGRHTRKQGRAGRPQRLDTKAQPVRGSAQGRPAQGRPASPTGSSRPLLAWTAIGSGGSRGAKAGGGQESQGFSRTRRRLRGMGFRQPYREKTDGNQDPRVLRTFARIGRGPVQVRRLVHIRGILPERERGHLGWAERHLGRSRVHG